MMKIFNVNKDGGFRNVTMYQGVVVNIYLETEEGGSQAQDQPELHSETCLKNK
jgi:hypothetical protein